MYRDHQPIISEGARKGADAFRRTLSFVLCTIRVPLDVAAKDIDRVMAGDLPSRTIFGAKVEGLAYLAAQSEPLWSHCEHAACHLSGHDLADALVEIIEDVPGIGIAKAGFAAQMIYGVSGCLDTHNAARFGLARTLLREHDRRTGIAPWRRRIARYNRLIASDAVGGTERLWDTWCEYVATVASRGRFWGGPDEVSALHLAAIKPL
jgi:hypothetical protein